MAEPIVGLIEPFVTTGEAAAELRISSATVIRRIGEGAFPGAYQDGRFWRIPRSAWIAYLKRTGALPSEEPESASQVTS